MHIHYELELIDGVENTIQRMHGLDSLHTGPHRLLVDSSATGGNDCGCIVALLRHRKEPDHPVNAETPILGEFYD